jgi:hypothetical protein
MVAVKCLLLRYGRKPLTNKDFSISGPEVRKALRETFLGPKAAGRLPSLITWFDLIIIAGKGTTQQAKKFYEYMLRAEADSYICALSDDIRIPISELIQVVKCGDPTRWGSPSVAETSCSDWPARSSGLRRMRSRVCATCWRASCPIDSTGRPTLARCGNSCYGGAGR